MRYAGKNSPEPFCFFLIKSMQVALDTITDGAGHIISKGQTYIVGSHLGKIWALCNRKGDCYIVSDKDTFVYRDSVVYPFVNFQRNYRGKNNTCFITQSDYVDVLEFVEHSNMASL